MSIAETTTTAKKYGAGLIWAPFDRDRQFLHDRLAGTRIVFKR